MIITNITAENVLKYTGLELTDLPAQGVVAIAGQNESGKSTIGEVICFTLFGRTFSFGPDELEKIICWGQTRGTASLGFKMGEENEYQVSRFLDADGNQGARLHRQGQEDDPIACGVEAVNEAVCRLLGYNFEEFIESFYLAQREISTPHRHSQAVKTMAGLTAFDEAGAEFAQETREARLLTEELEPQIGEIDAELEELNIQEERLPELEAQREDLLSAQERCSTESQELKKAASAYGENLPRLQAARRGRSSNGVVSGLLILATLGSAIVAWMPEAQHLQGDFPWGLGCGIFGIMFLLSLGRLAILNGRVEGLVQASEELARRLETLPQAAEAQMEGGTDAGETPTAGELAAIYTRIASCAAGPEEVHLVINRVLACLEQESQARQAELESLEQTIYLEKERVATALKLQQTREATQQQIVDQQHRIEVREMALDLLAGAGRHLSQRFNRDLRDLVGRTLPLFTEGRYAHLKIDDELNVQVFSNEKRDFMQLEEISSGTQRQIMLAVRLALSQQLVDSVVGAQQFVFLDEPFAFFDQERTRSSLEVLPNLSDEITQVWTVAQEFPADSQFDRFIECSREYERLPPDVDIAIPTEVTAVEAEQPPTSAA
jgi:exonuclease SbcC